MTIDEAIKRAEKVVEKHEKLANTYESFQDYGNPKSSITSAHKKCLKCAEDYRQLAEWLKELKQLREQTRWIPVSERLPEDNDDVLVWCEWWDEDDFLCEWWNIGYYSYQKWKLKTPKRGINVVAWMPLPSSYQGESEE